MQGSRLLEELVELQQSPQDAACEIILRVATSAVSRWVPRQAAQDVVQDIMLKLWQRFDASEIAVLAPEDRPKRVQAFVSRVFKNAICDYYRQHTLRTRDQVFHVELDALGDLGRS